MPLNNHIKEWIAIFETAVIIFKLIWHDNLRGKRIKHTNISFLTIHSNDGMAQNCDLDCAGNTFFSFLSRIYSALGALNETLLQIGFSHQLMTRKRGWSKEQNFRRRDKFNRHGNFHYFFGTQFAIMPASGWSTIYTMSTMYRILRITRKLRHTGAAEFKWFSWSTICVLNSDIIPFLLGLPFTGLLKFMFSTAQNITLWHIPPKKRRLFFHWEEER